MNKEDLVKLGLDEAQISAIFVENGKDIAKYKQAVETLENDKGTLSTQLGEVQEQLKGFEGKDFDALQAEVSGLQEKIETQSKTYLKELSERDFYSLLTQTAFSNEAKDADLILAKLDADALKSSQNQKADMETAILALKETHPYLFKTEDSTQGTKMKTGGTHGTDPQTGEPPLGLKGAVASHYETKGE